MSLEKLSREYKKFKASNCDDVYFAVKGSKIKPYYEIPSNAYEYSNKEFALYLKDHKNKWNELLNIAGIKNNGYLEDEELFLIFPNNKFEEVSKVLHFIKKRGQKNVDKSRIKRITLIH
ncbi:hypothetical protein [Mycobacterium sp.]|uniref:hypothetical protein n=1 Tax=Mycobacterium sp. TaxID=1785 RepID=UPI0031E0E42E